MLKNKLLGRLLFILIFISVSLCLMFLLFYNILFASNLILPYTISPIDICVNYKTEWHLFKKLYIILYFSSNFFISNFFFNVFLKTKKIEKNAKSQFNSYPNFYTSEINLYLGKNSQNEDFYISEKGLYQNLLITGTIGTGKTSSAMYPITKQLISYQCNVSHKKLGMLILDVKGNYHYQTLEYAKQFNREKDVITIDLSRKCKIQSFR